MAAKEWQQHQLDDGTYTMDDLIDWHEMAAVRRENEERFRIFIESKNSRN